MANFTPEEADAIKQSIFTNLHCAMPGIVESYDSEAQTADIRLAFAGMPVLKNVPVFMPVEFVISANDACLVIFSDKDIDTWMEGENESDPASGRSHSISDGFAFVGFKRGGSV